MGQPTCSSFGSTSETGPPMDYAKLFQLLALGCVCVGCSTANTGSISSQSPQGSVRFEHRTEARSDGKTVLIVVPTINFVGDRAVMDREAQAYADRYANQSCPKGHDFYGNAPLGSGRNNERTFVFKCR